MLCWKKRAIVWWGKNCMSEVSRACCGAVHQSTYDFNVHIFLISTA
jgi:hypothetical protein